MCCQNVLLPLTLLHKQGQSRRGEKHISLNQSRVMWRLSRELRCNPQGNIGLDYSKMGFFLWTQFPCLELSAGTEIKKHEMEKHKIVLRSSLVLSIADILFTVEI